MMKVGIKVKYYWHTFRYRYHELLLNDCLCSNLRMKLQGKANYHERKAISLLVKL